jgi:hypothetical protein
MRTATPTLVASADKIVSSVHHPVLVVAVPFSFRGATAVCTPVHSTPSTPSPRISKWIGLLPYPPKQWLLLEDTLHHARADAQLPADLEHPVTVGPQF